MELPKYPHSAIICGQTGCGKTEFVLNLLEVGYRGVFRHIVIFCPPFNGTRHTKIVNGLVTSENRKQRMS